MSTSAQSVLGSTQNAISAHVPGVTVPLLNSVVNLVNASTSYALMQSGQIVTVPAIAAGCTITLPPVVSSKGHQFQVVCSGTLGQILTITAPANTMRGFAMQKGSSAADSYTDFVQAGTAGTNTSLRFAATAIAGDRMSCFCDGSFWFVQAYSAVETAGTPTFSFV
jgi:hypothetical protein